MSVRAPSHVRASATARWLASPSGAAPQRFLWLDGLRGAAATAVLFWHYQHFFAGPGAPAGRDYRALEPLHAIFAPFYDAGFQAVPMFWMLSGFVFAAVYGHGKATTRGFIVNRFARLYPLHLVTLLLVVGLQVAAMHRFSAPLFYPNNDARHFVLQLFFASAWRRWDQSFNGPVWSVSIEVLVYAAFWLLHGRLFRRGIAFPLALSLLLGAARWAGVEHLFLYCGQLFFFGCALFVAHGALVGGRGHVPVALAMTAIGATLWVSGIAGLVAGMPFTFGGIVLLLSALDASDLPRPRKLLSFAGDNTYGMYLWHVPLQMIVLLLAPSIAVAEDWARSPWWLAAFLLTVIVVGRASFLFIERPARERIRRFGKTRTRDAPIAAP